MPRTKNTKKRAHISPIKVVLTPRGTAATAKKGFKRPSHKLDELLRLANLALTSKELPALTPTVSQLGWMSPGSYNLMAMIAPLPDAIRLDILENAVVPPVNDLVSASSSRPTSPSRNPSASGKPSASASPSVSPTPSRSPSVNRSAAEQQEYCRCLAAHKRYQTILDAMENLRRLIDKTGERLRFSVEATVGADGRVNLQPADENWAIKALLNAEVDYLARCAYGKCGRFFYAGRLPQPGCNPEHSEIIRKQRKRDRDKANRDINKMRSKKRRPK